MFRAGNFPDQQWNIRHLNNNIYTVQNAGTNRYLEVPFARCANGENVATWRTAGANHQRWIISKEGSSYFFRPVHCDSRALDRKDGKVNATAHIWGFNTRNANQRWRLVRLGNARAAQQEDGLNVFATPNRQVEVSWTLDQYRDKVPAEYIVEYAEGEDDFEIIQNFTAEEGIDEAYQFVHDTPQVGFNHYQVTVKYTDGSEETVPFESVYLDEIQKPIAMYPNPSQGELFLDLSDYKATKINYLVANLSGQILLNGEFKEDHQDKEQLQLTELENGSYLVFLRPEGQKELVQKVLIKKTH